MLCKSSFIECWLINLSGDLPPASDERTFFCLQSDCYKVYPSRTTAAHDFVADVCQKVGVRASPFCRIRTSRSFPIVEVLTEAFAFTLRSLTTPMQVCLEEFEAIQKDAADM